MTYAKDQWFAASVGAPPLSGTITLLQSVVLPTPTTRASSSAHAAMSEDGLTLVYSDIATLYGYTMSTAFDLDTLSYVGSKALGASNTFYAPRFVDGGDLLVGLQHSVGDRLSAIPMSTPYNITTGTTPPVYGNIAGVAPASGQAGVYPDGTTVMVGSRGGLRGINFNTESTLSIAFDVTSLVASAAGQSPNLPASYAPGNLTFSLDGKFVMAIGGTIPNPVWVYELGTPFDASSAALVLTTSIPSVLAFQGFQVFIDEDIFIVTDNASKTVQKWSWSA